MGFQLSFSAVNSQGNNVRVPPFPRGRGRAFQALWIPLAPPDWDLPLPKNEYFTSWLFSKMWYDELDIWSALHSLVYFHRLDRDSVPSWMAWVSNHLCKATCKMELLNTESESWNISYPTFCNCGLGKRTYRTALPARPFALCQRTWTVIMTERFWERLCQVG